MKIPLDYPHWVKFYKEAKAQNISIESRFVGVSVNINGGKMHWVARYNGASGAKFLGRFSFDAVGERTAALAYEEYRKTVMEKSKYPGRVNKSKIHYQP